MSSASTWMFDGKPRHLLLVLFLQDPTRMLGVQQERDEFGQGGDQDPSQPGVVNRDLLD